MYWSNDEDIQNDMLELSAFYNPTAPEPAPEPSDIKKKLCGKPSIFEEDYQDDEPPQEQSYVPVPIRGHPLLQNGIRRPGGYPTTKNQHLQTSALIREVSGFGYSNDLIEHAFKASNSEDEKDLEKMKNLIFESPSRSKPNSRKSGDESDSNASTTSECISYSSRSNSCGNINGIDIYSKTEFPDLKCNKSKVST